MPRRSTQFAAVAIAIIAVVGAALLSQTVQQQRKDLRLVYDVQGGEEMQVDSILARAALGSFRGIAVNALWYHAEQQKQAGRLFDANDTAQLITTLQPRFPQVWAFNAWNMAYNISVLTHTPGERWDWVQKGIHLLRDEGIPENPTSVRLYRELSWIFFHKVGQWSDDMHWYYKQQLAQEWQLLLGTPPRGYQEGLATQAFEPIAAAAEAYFLFDRPPREVRNELDALADEVERDHRLLSERLLELKWADAENLREGLVRLSKSDSVRRAGIADELAPLIERAEERLTRARREPLSRLRREMPEVSSLLARLDEMGRPVGQSVSQDRQALMTLGRLAIGLSRGVPVDRMPPDLRALAELRVDPSHAEAWSALLAFLRAKVLTGHYRMDPAFMHELMEEYGPLDWRHPAAQSVYWAAMGIERSELLRSGENIDFINTYRRISQGLQSMTHEGRVVFDPITGGIDYLPNALFIRGYEKAVFEGREISALYRDLDERESHFDEGYKNFLGDAVVYSYLYNNVEQSRKYYEKLRERFGDTPKNRDGLFDQPLDQYILTEFIEPGIPSREGAIAFIDGRLTTAYTQGLAYGRLDYFEQQVKLARMAHRQYQKERSQGDPNAPRKRLALPAFPQMVAQSFESYLTSPRVDLLQRSTAYRQAPERLRGEVYDNVRSVLQQQVTDAGLSFERAFPPPPGYVPPAEELADPDAAEPDAGTVERK